MENQLINITNNNGVLTVGSLEVAEHFGKQHKDVLRSIENLAAQNCATKNMFIESTYENRGKQYPQYLITRDGFSLLVMGFTGKKALAWKLRYIEAFNKMEKALRQPQQLSIEDTYEYFDKYWRGTPIMSVRDIEYFTTISRYTISYQLRYNKVFVKGADFKLLQDHELQEFKRENPKISRLASSFIVITKSGFVKLMRVFGIKVETPQHFMIEKESSKTKMAVDLTSLYTAKYMFDRICVNLENMKKCIDTLSGPVTRELFQEGKETLEVLFERLDKAIKCVSSMDVTEQLEVLFY
ncbi:MAG: Rha family transcriptional regulator [Clostridia bacterium]|nr:Rha family transcriptional regulator [Clostridia bacterium]